MQTNVGDRNILEFHTQVKGLGLGGKEIKNIICDHSRGSVYWT